MRPSCEQKTDIGKQDLDIGLLWPEVMLALLVIYKPKRAGHLNVFKWQY